MAEIILHHYERSPFAEKVRLVLGAKGISWRSVIIPRWMPKPDLMPLTGGYRKTPVMQIGGDIYCDTRIILREIERRLAAPPWRRWRRAHRLLGRQRPLHQCRRRRIRDLCRSIASRAQGRPREIHERPF